MIVGLTGGIGSGKSTIAKLFEIFGCIVFDSDSVAKQLYFDPIIKSHIIKLLGEESYVSENKINKKYISSIIFSNSNKLERTSDPKRELKNLSVGMVSTKFLTDLLIAFSFLRIVRSFVTGWGSKDKLISLNDLDIL